MNWRGFRLWIMCVLHPTLPIRMFGEKEMYKSASLVANDRLKKTVDDLLMLREINESLRSPIALRIASAIEMLVSSNGELRTIRFPRDSIDGEFDFITVDRVLLKCDVLDMMHWANKMPGDGRTKNIVAQMIFEKLAGSLTDKFIGQLFGKGE